MSVHMAVKLCHTVEKPDHDRDFSAHSLFTTIVPILRAEEIQEKHSSVTMPVCSYANFFTYQPFSIVVVLLEAFSPTQKWI